MLNGSVTQSDKTGDNENETTKKKKRGETAAEGARMRGRTK